MVFGGWGWGGGLSTLLQNLRSPGKSDILSFILEIGIVIQAGSHTETRADIFPLLLRRKDLDRVVLKKGLPAFNIYLKF